MAYFGVISSQISDRLKCAEMEESLAAIMAQKEGLPDWRWVVRDFPMIPRKSRTDNVEFKGALFLDPNRGFGYPIFGVISCPTPGRLNLMCQK